MGPKCKQGHVITLPRCINYTHTVAPPLQAC